MSVPVILLGVGMFTPEARADTAELMFRVAWFCSVEFFLFGAGVTEIRHYLCTGLGTERKV